MGRRLLATLDFTECVVEDRLGPRGSPCTSQNNGNNAFGDIRFLCLAKWDLRNTDWLVTIGLCPDAQGMYVPLDHGALLS